MQAAHPVRRDRRSTWTQAQIRQLRQRWATGASASRIAHDLGGGISRSAVLAKVRRLRFARRRPDRPGPSARDPIRPISLREVPSNRRRAGTSDTRRHPSWVANAKPYVDALGVNANIPPAQRRSILDLRNDSCRWPVGDPASADFFFCGADALAGRPYCAEHCTRAYRRANSE